MRREKKKYEIKLVTGNAYEPHSPKLMFNSSQGNIFGIRGRHMYLCSLIDKTVNLSVNIRGSISVEKR